MKNYKKLPCDNYNDINQQIYNYVLSTGLIDSSTQFWNPISAKDLLLAAPLFQTWLAALKLMLHSAAVTIGRNTDCCSIHTDTPPAVNKLSWPIHNTRGTYNRWFTPCVETPTVKINQLGGSAYIDPAQLIQIDRMEVIEPSIINAGIPHDVWFDSTAVFPRIGLQCQLIKEPSL
jgi:hypothetical protein